MIKLLLYINVDMQVKCMFACNSVFQKDCGPFISQIQNINGTRKCREVWFSFHRLTEKDDSAFLRENIST